VPTDNPQVGIGATLGYKLVGGATFLPAAMLLSLGTSPSVGTVEVPLLSLTSKMKLPTIFDGGEISSSMAFNTADPAIVAFQGYMQNYTQVVFLITYPDGGTHGFNGFITGMSAAGVRARIAHHL